MTGELLVLVSIIFLLSCLVSPPSAIQVDKEYFPRVLMSCSEVQAKFSVSFKWALSAFQLSIKISRIVSPLSYCGEQLR